MILENPEKNLELPSYTDNKRRSLTDQGSASLYQQGRPPMRNVRFSLSGKTVLVDPACLICAHLKNNTLE